MYCNSTNLALTRYIATLLLGYVLEIRRYVYKVEIYIKGDLM